MGNVVACGRVCGQKKVMEDVERSEGEFEDGVWTPRALVRLWEVLVCKECDEQCREVAGSRWEVDVDIQHDALGSCLA
jgi:hypothetical protein